jgi:hypothetical protein
MTQQLTQTDFASCVSDRFLVRADAGPAIELELIEATRLECRAPPGQPLRREPFSLVFRGPVSPWLLQAIYPVEHARLGQLELFLVPIGPDQHGMRYEAVFN